MKYEIVTPNGYVFESMRDTGVAWKMSSGAGKQYPDATAAVHDMDALRERGYMCNINEVYNA